MAITEKPEFRRLRAANGDARPVARRSVMYSGGRLDTPVFRRDDLLAGHHFDGPAVVEEAASVTIVNPGQALTVDPYGNLLLATRA